MASNGVKWSDARKELYTPEELAEADRLKEQARAELEEEEHLMNKKLKAAYENVYPGWWPILDKYLPQIWAIDPDCDIIVKEKLGTLRIHPCEIKEGLSWKDFASIVDEAQKASATVCEICGDPGELRNKQRWIQTLCDRCAAMKPDERAQVGNIAAAKLLEEMGTEEPSEVVRPIWDETAKRYI